jgi:hypothetical protein
MTRITEKLEFVTVGNLRNFIANILFWLMLWTLNITQNDFEFGIYEYWDTYNSDSPGQY